MPIRLIRFTDLVLVALLVGTMFGIWLGYNPTSLSSSAYVEHQQLAIRSLNVVMPALGAACILLTGTWAVLARSNRRLLALLLLATILLVAAGLATRFLNQPINAEVITWNPLSPPGNWSELRDQWWHWHIVRTVAGIAALILLILGTEFERGQTGI
jgi:uncharacterized membrane protein